MLLVVGKFGIENIRNSNTGAGRSAISIIKGMELGGGPLHVQDETVCVGYNEEIICKTSEDALELAILIDGILSTGEKAETVVDRVEDVVKNLFFQEV